MLEGAEADRLWDYWRGQLAGDIPNIALPIDRPRPATQTYRGALHRFTLDAGLGTALREVGRRAGATPYVTFLAAFAALLHRYSGQDDLLIGSPFGCRDRPELEGLVGYIANPVVLRADVHGDPTFTSLLSRIKDTVLGALAHQDYPFALLVERLRPARDLSHTPLSQVSFAWEQPRRFQDGPGSGGGPAALNLTTVHIGQGGAPVDLMMQVGDADGRVHLRPAVQHRPLRRRDHRGRGPALRDAAARHRCRPGQPGVGAAVADRLRASRAGRVERHLGGLRRRRVHSRHGGRDVATQP